MAQDDDALEHASAELQADREVVLESSTTWIVQPSSRLGGDGTRR